MFRNLRMTNWRPRQSWNSHHMATIIGITMESWCNNPPCWGSTQISQNQWNQLWWLLARNTRAYKANHGFSKNYQDDHEFVFHVIQWWTLSVTVIQNDNHKQDCLATLAEYWIGASKFRIRHQISKENAHREPLNWKAVKEALDAIGADGMSSDETEEELLTQEMHLARVPVQWIHPDLTDLFYFTPWTHMAVDNEGFMALCGNRPIPRLPISNTPVMRNATKKLLWNWYNDTWFKFLSDPKKSLLNPGPSPLIPSLVSPI